jgi:hypothetical protein
MYPRAQYSDSSDWENIPNPAASEKHDGANFFAVVGDTGAIRYFSRRPSVRGGFPERTAQLPHLTKPLLKGIAGNVYNVELVHTGHSSRGKEDHPKLSGILNSLPEKSIQTQEKEGPVRAILLNVIHPKINTYGEKLIHLKEVEKAFGDPEIFKSVSVKIQTSDIKDLIQTTKQMGKEGVIITSLTTPEDKNKRIKIKHYNTYNLKVTGINQEYDKSGNPKQSAGSLTVADSMGREVGYVGTGFSAKLRQEIWSNPNSWINKSIQVKARTPSRRRLLASVYNGDPDGHMDKVAETIEDRLLQNLVSTYTSKGLNMQKILDNPLFQQLTLAKKIEFLDKASSPVASPVNFDYNNIKIGLGGGGIAGAIATAMLGVTPINMPRALAVGAVAGSIFGGLSGYIRAVKDKKRDEETRKSLLTSGGMAALVLRSGSSPIKGSPFTGNKFLDNLDSAVEGKIPNIARLSSIAR